MSTQFTTGLAFASITAMCWAVLAIVLKFTLTFADSGSIVWLRMFLAFAVMAAFFGLKNPKSLRVLVRPPVLALLAGLFLSFNYFGYMKGVEMTTASNTQIMIQLGPLLLAISGILYFKESLQKTQLIGLAIASIGFFLFYWDQILLSWQHHHHYVVGNLWVITAALAWAAFAIFQKLQTKKMSPQEFNLVLYAVSSVSLLPVMKFNLISHISFPHWLVLIFLGINTIIAYGSLGEALKRIPATYVSLVITLNPLLTIFLIHILYHYNLLFITFEPVSWKGLLGAIFVVGGVATVIALRPKSVSQIDPKLKAEPAKLN